ncbi:MAG: HAMP domain-containing histidine kinase [Deltaproteobacteria bacterium]|nr:HAMP domain-containing histidine kinase [Deltaproteobacteria bacterium]MCW5803378.1 HAMP domain-containing histidine kinase [Deltaproteobacteria bacterium]
MRRLLLLNALIFAVLAAAAALAYYSFSATSEGTAREREITLMEELAEEKVTSLEQVIDYADSKLMRGVNLDELSADQLDRLPKAHGAAVLAIYVLDEHFKPVPNGFSARPHVREARLDPGYRTWFLDKVVPVMGMAKKKADERGHLYFTLEGTPTMFSYMRRLSGDRTFYVVVEDDLNYIIFTLFNQFFHNSDASKRLYEVRDDKHAHRFGYEFGDASNDFLVEQKFRITMDDWTLRVAQRDETGREELRRKQVINSVLIGGAVTVILAGLAVLGFAIRRERRLSELKSEFISNVSHELKTPLSIISMFGEMLANGRTKSAEQAHEYAEIIWRESVRLGRLIDNVLDFAKIERGAVYEFEDADVGEVVERAVELSGRRVAAAEMTLEADIAPELPMVRLDANAFTLAVLNLIDNAIKYAADGKRIELALRRDGDQRVVLSVRDWGQGIDPEEHERIFERFYRARAIRLKPIRGSGIGLALVQHIARAHGGDATVTSAPGAGSTFSIWLPVA